MPNWWTNIREKGAEAARELARKTVEATEVAKTKFGRLSATEDLDKSFILQLSHIKSAPQLAELHHKWLVQILQKDGGTYNEGDIHLHFRQVFLRSTSLESSIELICRDVSLRQVYSYREETDPTDPLHNLFLLFEACLACPPPVWRSLWKTIGSQELLSERHVEWIGNIFRVLKHDWQDEVYYSERKQLAVKAEALRAEIRYIKVFESF